MVTEREVSDEKLHGFISKADIAWILPPFGHQNDTGTIENVIRSSCFLLASVSMSRLAIFRSSSHPPQVEAARAILKACAFENRSQPVLLHRLPVNAGDQ